MRTSRLRSVVPLGAIALLAGAESALFAQVPVVLRAPSCTTCRVELSHVRVLDAPESEPLEDWPFSVAMDSRGRVALSIKGGAGLPRVTSEGSHVLAPLGRVGSGPGEYRMPTTVVFGSGDTLSVFDPGNGRRTTLDPSNRVVTSSPYVGGTAVVRVLASGDVLVSHAGRERFSVIDRRGVTVRSFGAGARVAPGRRVDTWWISNVVANRFWAVTGRAYQLEHWSIDGRLIARMQREVDWLTPRMTFSDGGRGAIPTAFLHDLRVDSRGRLWTLVGVPAVDWRKGLGPVDRSRGFDTYPQRDFARLFDTMIEVIDPSTRRLIASTRVPGYVRFLLDDQHVAALREGRDGEPVIEVRRMSLVGDGPGTERPAPRGARRPP